MFKLAFLSYVLAASGAVAVPLGAVIDEQSPRIGKRCTGSIQSLDDVANAVKCTTINIGGFTVPAGRKQIIQRKTNEAHSYTDTFTLAAPDNAVINLTGALTFGVSFWAGPLFVITGNNVTCKPFPPLLEQLLTL